MRGRWLILLLAFLTGCTARRSNALDDSVRGYIRLAVALGEHDLNSLDYSYEPAEWVADVRAHPPSYLEIRKSAETLIASLDHVQEEPVRVRFLQGQLRAIAARADLLRGVHRTFDDEARALFALGAPPPSDLSSIRSQIAKVLPGAGSLAGRYAHFEEQFVIPPDRMPAVFERALAECRTRTKEHLSLPPHEGVTVEYVSDKPWNAFSRYLGNARSRIQVNAEFPMTVDRILALACHEGYPGHHVYNSLQDSDVVQKAKRWELSVQPTFSPQSFQSEAAATVAADMAFPPEERLHFEQNVLFPLAGLDPRDAAQHIQVERAVEQLANEETQVARSFLDGNLEWARAAAALEDRALMAHAEPTLMYFNEYRTYMLTYTLGHDLASACLLNPAQDRWQTLQRLIRMETSIPECLK